MAENSNLTCWERTWQRSLYGYMSHGAGRCRDFALERHSPNRTEGVAAIGVCDNGSSSRRLSARRQEACTGQQVGGWSIWGSREPFKVSLLQQGRLTKQAIPPVARGGWLLKFDHDPVTDGKTSSSKDRTKLFGGGGLDHGLVRTGGTRAARVWAPDGAGQTHVWLISWIETKLCNCARLPGLYSHTVHAGTRVGEAAACHRPCIILSTQQGENQQMR